VALEYVEKGSGAPLVFVHGSISDLRTWGQQIDAFAERYRVIAYTRRYHRGSEDPARSRPHSVSTASDDLIALIERLGVAPAHLAGSSYGAFTSLLTAAKRPELVRTLTLGEPPVAHMLTSDPALRAVWVEFISAAQRPAQELARAGDLEKALRTFLDGVIGPGAFEMVPPPVIVMMMDNVATLAFEEPPLETFGEPEAKRVTMPVALVAGEHTPQMFPLIDDRLQRLMPHAKRNVIPAASHAMHGDNAEAYNAAVLEFLSKHA
jgi:pimeloyl-ACP methyl ester carboxylesterase